MAIYLDPPLWPAHGTHFSHLVSDSSLSELHVVAAAAGIPERAFDGDHYDVPEEMIPRLGFAPEETVSTMGRRAAVVREELVPIVSLDGTFRASEEPHNGRRELLLTRYAEQRVGVAVDRLLGRVQAVIPPLDDGLGRLGRFSGATIGPWMV